MITSKTVAWMHPRQLFLLLVRRQSAMCTTEGSKSAITSMHITSSISAIVLSLFVFADRVCGLDDSTHTMGTEYSEPKIVDDDLQHWAFLPVEHVDLPEPAPAIWRRNEIDDFVFRTLFKDRLLPQPVADRRTLVRRLCFDTVGLPALPELVEEFVTDKNSEAYDRLVDQLLSSPGYGQRWAQHWLDLARFAETDGFEHDKTRPRAWTYRDWVIDALNADMPYDEFVRLQIAGDELYPDDPSAETATRFCLSGPDMPDINLVDERRHSVLNELTATVGEVMLGLQIGCAQCHDHKYDPISQADFYRLRAVFEPAVQLQHNRSLSVFQETTTQPTKSYLLLRGDFRRRGQQVKPGVLRVVDTGKDYLPVPTDHSTGQRTALANWIACAENPLTSRVIVNRVWQQHFGTGLVDTPSDFGLMGSSPTHGKLLDWLANWFVEHDWSLKQLHRLILTSATWQQRSVLPEDADASANAQWQQSLKNDPNARLLSRFPRRRLDGEAIRDAMLTVSRKMNSTQGGPGIRPPLPEELLGTLLKGQWDVTTDVSEHGCRSIYVFARRNLRYPLFESFDRPAGNASCSRRDVSITAPQSLHLLNSEFSFKTAHHIADIVRRQHGGDESLVKSAFFRVLGRYPSEREVEAATKFLRESVVGGDDGDERLVHLCLSLLNCNEFIFID